MMINELPFLGVIIPTSNRIEIVRFWVEKNADVFLKNNADIIFFDSSDESHSSEIQKYILASNKRNVIYARYEEDVDDVICYKVYDAAKKYCQKYDFLWIVRDRSVINIHVAMKYLKEGLSEQYDFFVAYPHEIPKGWRDAREYTNANELMLDLFGEMTSLGSIIFSSKVLTNIVENYPVDENTNRGLWLVVPLFWYIANHSFKALFFLDETFTYLPYGNSYWIKKKTLLSLFSKQWNKIVDALPEEYNKVKESVRRFQGWSIPPFSIQLILSGRAAGDFGLFRIFKYYDELKKCAPDKIRTMFFVSMIPPFVVQYYLAKGRNRLSFRMARKMLLGIRDIIDFVASLLPRRKSCKKRTERDYSLRKDNFISTDEIKSILLKGNVCENKPYISIVIPTMKRSELLKEAIESVIRQRSVNYDWELIVVDNEDYDGRKNDTQKLIEKYTIPNLFYFRNEKNLGITGNMNRGVQLAHGEWVALLHDDDMLFDDFLYKIEKCISALKNIGITPGIIFSDCCMYKHKSYSLDENAHGDFLLSEYITHQKSKCKLIQVTDCQFVYTGDSGLNAPSYGCTYHKKDFLDAGGMRPENDIGLLADFTLNYLIMENKKVFRCDSPFGVYRWSMNESSKKVHDIMCDYYDLREYKYTKHLWSNVLKGILRYEHIGWNRDVFSYLDYKASNNAYTELVNCHNNLIRSYFSRIIKYIYLKYQSSKAIEINLTEE